MVIAKRDPRVQIAPQYIAQRRTSRRPQHRFNLRMSAYSIQPFMLAPVIPGETFESSMIQSQVWSDPLAPTMRNVGWWLNYNWFYVRHRDLPETVRDTLVQMMLEPGTDVAALKATAQSWPLYTYDGSMNWTQMCLEHIVSEYFRDEGEDWDDFTDAAGLPLVQIYGRGSSDGIERLTLEGDYEDRRVDLIDGDGHLYADDVNTMMGHWQAMRDAGLTEMDYHDFMKTYGSKVREDEESPNLHRAEDVWSLREFTYPTNTVEPTNGVPSVAAGWRVQKTGGKRLYCDEPGFIFGVTYVRPKVYMGNLKGSLAGAMDHVHRWLPALLNEHVDLAHVLSPFGTGPAPNVGVAEPEEGYYIDLRDLLLYGDQFVNFDPAGEAPFVPLPAADGTRRYATPAQIQGFFASSEAMNFYVDGLCSLSIKGRVQKSTSGIVLGQS